MVRQKMSTHGKSMTTGLAGLLILGLASTAQADLLADAAAEETAPPGAGGIAAVEIIEMAGSQCEDWIASRQWSVGSNQKKDGTTFFVAVGSGTIQAKPGHPAYIDSRQNAYEKAVLNAKASLVSYMEKQIQTDLVLAVKQGDFSAGPIQTSDDPKPESKEPEEFGWQNALQKTMRLLHAELDNQLSKRGVDPSPEPSEEEKQAAEAAAREVLNTEEFRQLIRSTSKAQLKGVRRMFVYETVKPGERGTICTALLGSPKTMAMADAIMTGNPDLAPTGYFGSPLDQQIADTKDPKGVLELLTTYGVQMSRDEVGEFHLISYAQSGTKSDTKQSMSIAKKAAKERAAAAIATFAREHAAISTRTENAETSKEFTDAMGEIDYENNSSFEEVIASSTPTINLAGGRVYKTWAARHPVTQQTVVGVIYVWSAQSAVAAKQLKNNIETTTQANKPVPEGTLNGQGFQGSASRGASQSDF